MHDIDSTRLEFNPESESYSDTEFEFPNHAAQNQEGTLMTDAEEEAMAAELLGVGNESEMDQFLGGLFKKIGRKLGGAVKNLAKNAGPLAGVLKGIAAQALPVLGGALGTAIPIPGVGTALGTALGTAASSALQGEMENLQPEEQEFEVAKRFVRLASQAAYRASRPIASNPTAAAALATRQALQTFRRPRRYYGWPAWQQFAPCPPCAPCAPCPQPEPAGMQAGGGTAGGAEPGSSQPGAPAGASGEYESFGDGESEGEEAYETSDELTPLQSPGGGRSGRWVRRGQKIVLYGI